MSKGIYSSFPTSAVGEACSVLASSAIAPGLGYGALYLESTLARYVRLVAQ